jgi:hypothetical protein
MNREFVNQKLFIKNEAKPGLVVHTYNLSTQNGEAGS